jgi:hypothetical protein
MTSKWTTSFGRGLKLCVPHRLRMSRRTKQSIKPASVHASHDLLRYLARVGEGLLLQSEWMLDMRPAYRVPAGPGDHTEYVVLGGLSEADPAPALPPPPASERPAPGPADGDAFRRSGPPEGPSDGQANRNVLHRVLGRYRPGSCRNCLHRMVPCARHPAQQMASNSAIRPHRRPE